jgi:ABC-2 type transport system permease protein
MSDLMSQRPDTPTGRWQATVWQGQWIALQTIVTREVRRFMRIWVQTLIPPAITMALYFIIFGNLIGARLGQMRGVDYVQFIVPGLIMMSVITNAYSNVASSFFSNKFQNCIEEMLVSPVMPVTILVGFVVGGVSRGCLVGLLVMCLSLFFTNLPIASLWVTFVTLILTATLFAVGGFINALFARKFDDISIVPTFVLTPLTYLGGVFYSISLLPEFWQTVSLANPIVYMVNAFRYGLIGLSDVPIVHSFFMMILFNVVLFTFALWLLHRGVGIKE